MTRPPIPLTAAEWASVQPDGSLWLAWEGDDGCCDGASPICPPCQAEPTPPVEFVQACAPCETCGDQRIAVSGGPGYFKGGKLRHRAGGQTVMEIHCPACRIELVGPCEIDGCRWSPHRTVGHAYAIGQPLLLTAENIGHHYFRLAHYGPPETLVGHWAMQLRVVQ